jgi:glycosyltransferase involved in cell wall biosynthesis
VAGASSIQHFNYISFKLAKLFQSPYRQEPVWEPGFSTDHSACNTSKLKIGIKKIVFAVTTDLNYDQRMQRICHSLQRAGYAVTLVGREWAGSRPLQPQMYTQHRLRCFFSKGKLFYLEFNFRLTFFLFSRGDDAYGAIDLDTALPVFGKAFFAGKHFIYDAHEYFPETPEVIRRPAVKWCWQAVERFIVSRTRHAYTVSASLAALFGARYQVPFALIRNMPVLEVPALSQARPDLPFIPAEPFILYQGAVNEGRGLEQLLLAMPQVKMPLLICGEGDILERLQSQVCQAGLTQRVTFAGYVLPADLAVLTSQAFVGIMLLADTGKSYYYSLANKFFDYIQAGIPQLLPDFPEYRALNDQYEVGLFCDLNPRHIAQALNRLLDEPALHQRLSQNCCRARRELCWQEEEKKLLAFYDHLWK